MQMKAHHQKAREQLLLGVAILVAEPGSEVGTQREQSHHASVALHESSQRIMAQCKLLLQAI